MATISAKIDELQNLLDSNKHSLDELEKRLKLDLRMTEKDRMELEDEFVDLDEAIQTDEKELKRLRGENRVSMLFSTFIFVLIVIIYFALWGPPV